MNERFAVEGVSATTDLGIAAPALLLAKAEPLFRLEEAARGGTDMDAVHDMRVASRRLREAMRLLAPIYPGREFRRWQRQVRDITRMLGPVRDADVFIDDFSRMARDLKDGGKRAAAFLIGRRMGLRERDLERLKRGLGHLDLEASRRSFAKLARSATNGPTASRPLAEFARAAIAERADVVAEAQPLALEESRVLEQHALRIDYKRLRYAVEVFAPCYGDGFDALHTTLTSFQDALGNLHDLHLFAEAVRDPETARAAKRAGVATADLEEIAVKLDERARAEYRAFRSLADEWPADTLLAQLLSPLPGPTRP
ncbi:MAG: CHAD domain-containing protein [Coriobacteriia bacterium]